MSTTANEAALVRVYAEHRLSLVRLARLLVDDFAAAEDVVQDACAAALRSAGQLRDAGAALAYLRAAVVNGSRSALRRRGSERRALPRLHVGSQAGPDEPLLIAEEHRAVLAALRQLPGRQREVLVLRFWSELPEADIAHLLGISRGTVKSTTSRALDALESLLGGAE